jgi:hypothetical protein
MVTHDPAEALRPVVNAGESIRELWPLFLFIAALLIPFDVGVRRLALPAREIALKAWQALAGKLRRQESVAPISAQVERLQQAKKRAATEASADQPTAGAVLPKAGPEVKREPKSKAPIASGSAAQRLLDAKRKRGE